LKLSKGMITFVLAIVTGTIAVLLSLFVEDNLLRAVLIGATVFLMARITHLFTYPDKP
jgi:hypothetical protein